MRNLTLTLETAVANLALDEALLEAAEADRWSDPTPSHSMDLSRPHGVLRLWEPRQYYIVLGRSSQPQQEVSLAICAGDGVPLLRRCSGGAAIVAGPGCLMYALVLGYEALGFEAQSALPVQPLPDINATHRFVLERIAQSLPTLTTDRSQGDRSQGDRSQGDRGQGDIVQAGISDLVISARHPQWGGTRLHKFSGNSLRCKRTHFLYHGTLLYDFDLPRISRWLKAPPRQPAYRAARSHDTFLANLPVTRDEIVQALIQGWQAQRPLDDWPRERTARLVQEKYSADLGAWI